MSIAGIHKEIDSASGVEISVKCHIATEFDVAGVEINFG
jgi:hypothetical protein